MISTRSWTHPTTGQVRHYLDIPQALGMGIDRYHTGNIRSATLPGHSLSVAEASRIARSTAWMDDDGTLHVVTTARIDLEELLREAIGREGVDFLDHATAPIQEVQVAGHRWRGALDEAEKARQALVGAIQTALEAGVSKRAICHELALARSTLDRWLTPGA